MKRRDFFKVMGIASGAAIAACNTNNADRTLLPYLVPPEDGTIPGVPRFSRSTCMECPAHCGLQVTILDDKPVKLEGNLDHPINTGALCMRGQASLARLYHTERFTQPLLKDSHGTLKPVSWDTALHVLKTTLKENTTKGKKNVYLASQTTGSLATLLDEFCGAMQIERQKEVELFNHSAIKNAGQQLFGLDVVPRYRIDSCDTLVTVGADIFETFLSPVEWMKQFQHAQKNKYFRWFHVEPYLSLTGAAAEHRAPLKPGSETYLLAYLLRHVRQKNSIPAELMAAVPVLSLTKTAELTNLSKEFITAITQTLSGAQNPLLICGGPSTANTNGSATALYGALLQWSLGMVGENGTVDYSHSLNNESVGTMFHLASFIHYCNNGSIGTALFSRFHGASVLPGLLPALKKIPFKVALAETPDELTALCDLVLPLSHPMESWGDATPRKGLFSIIQPVLEPIHQTKSEGDMLLLLMGRNISYRDYLADHWQGRGEHWITRGFILTDIPAIPVQLVAGPKLSLPSIPQSSECLFITPSIRTFDGRSADIALLAEIPDPMTAITYGQWVAISPAEAEKAKLVTGDILTLTTKAGTLTLPVAVSPGLTAGQRTLSIDACAGLALPTDLVSGQLLFCLDGVTLTPTGKTSRLACLSGSYTTGKRGILPEDDFHDPKAANAHHHEYKRHTLYPPHEHKDYRWGLVIDLDACTGCAACVAACYIENNVPLTGKIQHLKGREASWLRIEPYYNDPAKPEFLPMMCQQCDCAPCENVCPVFATYHTPEGLNAQVYNRCVGTRYCANNCPYQVRRFNWFAAKDNLPLYTQSNPALSVRPGGVMEKCSFCIQRIRAAKDQAKDEKRLVKDGEVQPACAQTCPSGAITFGNLMDPKTKVSVLVKTAGIHRVLEELGTEPAVYYIKKDRS